MFMAQRCFCCKKLTLKHITVFEMCEVLLCHMTPVHDQDSQMMCQN